MFYIFSVQIAELNGDMGIHPLMDFKGGTNFTHSYWTMISFIYYLATGMGDEVVQYVSTWPFPLESSYSSDQGAHVRVVPTPKYIYDNCGLGSGKMTTRWVYKSCGSTASLAWLSHVPIPTEGP